MGIAPPFATQFANPLSAILHAPNPKTPFVTLNAKNPNVKLNALIRDVKCSTAPIALLTVKHLNPNANQSAKNLNVTGNATNPPAPSLSVNLFVKTPTVSPRLNAALAL